MSVAGPPQDANGAPSGGSASGESLKRGGRPMSAAGPPHDPNGPPLGGQRSGKSVKRGVVQ